MEGPIGMRSLALPLEAVAGAPFFYHEGHEGLHEEHEAHVPLPYSSLPLADKGAAVLVLLSEEVLSLEARAEEDFRHFLIEEKMVQFN
jgi:hypothetical protein